MGGKANWKGQMKLAKREVCWKGPRAALKAKGKLGKQKAACHAGRGGATGDRGGRQQRSSHKGSGEVGNSPKGALPGCPAGCSGL